MVEAIGALECKLLDRRSSVPLALAQVTIVWRTSKISIIEADKQGQFRLDLPEGVYDLVISARGYLSLFVRGLGILAGHEQQIMRALIPGVGQAPADEPATAIGGYVVDRLGRAVANITVNAHGERATYTTRTDRQGAYVLHGVIPEMYDITFKAHERPILIEHVLVPNAKEFLRHDSRLVNL